VVAAGQGAHARRRLLERHGGHDRLHPQRRDHHLRSSRQPRRVAGSLFRIAEAARQPALRSCLCYEVSDRDGAEVAHQGIEENRAFLEYCKHSGDDLLRGLFGMHASFTLSDKR
jgi:hypothetical protein